MSLSKNPVVNYVYYAASLLLTALFVFEVPQVVFYAPVALFVLYFVHNRIKKEVFRIPLSAFVLMAFTIVFIIFNYDTRQSFYYQSYIYIQAVMLFLMGYNFYQSESVFEQKTKQLEAFFLAVSVFYIVYIAVTFLHYYLFTPADLEVRFYYSIWYDFVKKPATVISMSLVIPLTFGVYSLFFLPLPKKIVGAVFIMITLGVNIFTETRTLVYLTPFILLTVFFVWAVFRKKDVKLGVVVTLTCIAVITAVVIYYQLNKYSLALKFKDTVFARYFSYGIGSNDRHKFSRYVLENFSFTYLGSGFYSAECGTPHNIWLYIYDYGGIVSFIVYCVFTVFLLIGYIRFLFNKKLGLEIKTLISTVFGVMFIEYFLEPFILPLPSFYLLTLFVFGLFCGLAKYPFHKEEKTWSPH